MRKVKYKYLLLVNTCYGTFSLLVVFQLDFLLLLYTFEYKCLSWKKMHAHLLRLLEVEFWSEFFIPIFQYRIQIVLPPLIVLNDSSKYIINHNNKDVNAPTISLTSFSVTFILFSTDVQ